MELVKDSYLESLLRGQATSRAGSWPESLRAEALERAHALALPSTRDEEWRFTDLAPLHKLNFQRAGAPPAIAESDIVAFRLPEAACRQVFVDGHYAAALSSALPDSGARVERLAAALARRDPTVQAHLAQRVEFGSEPFAAVNTAWLQDGVVVHVARDTLTSPVHLLFVSTQADVATTPRVLVVAEAGSECALIEDFVALHEGAYLTNGVTEIEVAASARVRHVRVQREGASAFHIASCGVRLQRDARYESVSLAFGGRISRFNLDVRLAGEGADARLDGLALIAGKQLADTHSRLDHAQPNGRSRQMHKCIVGGAGHAVFNGKILVRPGAQRTDSSQESRNLLLTERAHVDTKPQLEIFADDVKCAHGAAVGQLDPDQIFYIRSRGLSESAARDLLTFAFAAEIVERIPLRSLAERLRSAVLRETQARSVR